MHGHMNVKYEAVRSVQHRLTQTGEYQRNTVRIPVANSKWQNLLDQ